MGTPGSVGHSKCDSRGLSTSLPFIAFESEALSDATEPDGWVVETEDAETEGLVGTPGSDIPVKAEEPPPALGAEAGASPDGESLGALALDVFGSARAVVD